MHFHRSGRNFPCASCVLLRLSFLPPYIRRNMACAALYMAVLRASLTPTKALSPPPPPLSQRKKNIDPPWCFLSLFFQRSFGSTLPRARIYQYTSSLFNPTLSGEAGFRFDVASLSIARCWLKADGRTQKPREIRGARRELKNAWSAQSQIKGAPLADLYMRSRVNLSVSLSLCVHFSPCFWKVFF